MGHPEQVARLQEIERAIGGKEFANLVRKEAKLANDTDLLRCHPKDYIEGLVSCAPRDETIALDGDTHMSPGTLNAARRAVGGNLEAVDLVLNGTVSNAFVACRPPGHHAETAKPMGFCLFGNVAIAAKYALDHHGLDRVAVIDFDVHHGNGTQDLLWSENRTLYCSTHQMPLYPGSGAAAEIGAHGNVLNVPLDADSSSAKMRAAYEHHIFPAVKDFSPNLILISAGFDAHKSDPLANLNWSTSDFRWVTEKICEMADGICDGRVVSSLEGGYELTALGQSVAAHVKALMEAA